MVGRLIVIKDRDGRNFDWKQAGDSRRRSLETAVSMFHPPGRALVTALNDP